MEILEAFAGKEVNDFVFFMDMRGTTAKLNTAWRSDNILDRAEVAHSQTHFISILGVLCKERPMIEAAQVSDCVFFHSAKIEDCLDFACATFKHMTVRGDKFSAWSLRGGGGRGLNRFLCGDEIRTLTNFSFSSVLGVGNVQAAMLESEGPKGMRLFVTKEVGEEAKKVGRFLLREVKVADQSCYEVNWMRPDGIVPDYLGLTKESRLISDHLRERGELFQKSGVGHQVDLGSSWLDLLGWTK